MKCNVWLILVVIGLVSVPAFCAAEDPPTSQSASTTCTDPLVVEGVIKAPVSEVWKVFSTAEGFKKLGVAQCEMEFRIGGLIRTHYDPKGTLGDEGTIQNEILSFEPQRVMSFRIHKPPKDFPFPEATWKQTWSMITLTDLGEGQTHVRLAGMGYTDTEESRKMRDFFKNGNAWVIQHLQQQFDSTVLSTGRSAHAEDPLAPIVHERVIELPRSEVWKLLATSAGWKQFFEADTRIELRPGGKFEILFDPQAPEGQRGSEGCAVLSFIPDEMLSYTWSAPPKFEHARQRRTWVVVRFDQLAPGRTRVRLDHLGFAEEAAENPSHRAEWEQVRAYFQRAWGKVLDALKEQEGKRRAGGAPSNPMTATGTGP
jgi:uncharacterized protein YndB with AHSA1/START domain